MSDNAVLDTIIVHHEPVPLEAGQQYYCLLSNEDVSSEDCEACSSNVGVSLACSFRYTWEMKRAYLERGVLSLA